MKSFARRSAKRPAESLEDGGRVACVNLSDENALRLFQNNILAATQPQDMFTYSTMNFKNRPVWPEMYVHRSLLADAFAVSAGFLLRQKRLLEQLIAFMAKHSKGAKEAELEDALYRLRCMMSQLRAAKWDDRAVPKAYSGLQAVYASINLGSPTIDDGDCCEDMDMEDSELSVVPSAKKIVHAVDISDDELDWTALDKLGDIDTLFDGIFVAETPETNKAPYQDYDAREIDRAHEF